MRIDVRIEGVGRLFGSANIARLRDRLVARQTTRRSDADRNAASERLAADQDVQLSDRLSERPRGR